MGCLVRNIPSTSHPYPRLKDHRGKGGENIIQAKGCGEPEQNSVLWLWQDHFSHQLTAPVGACTEPAHEQAGQRSRMEWEGFMSSPWLFDGFWEKVSFFF